MFFLCVLMLSDYLVPTELKRSCLNLHRDSIHVCTKSMASKKVMIRWHTKCAWNGRQQPVPRKDIDPPKPASLAEGERIRVKFSGRWYNAFVVTSWSKEQKG